MAKRTKQPRKFKGHRGVDELQRMCEERGWGFDRSRYDAGSDYVRLEFRVGRKSMDILYSGFNGRFYVQDKGDTVTEESVEMEGTAWYDSLLDFLYEPLEEAA